MEQSTGQWTLTQRAHAAASGTLAEDGHVVRVTAKLLDILLNPFQRLNLVENAVVARYVVGTLCREQGVYQESEHAQTVVDRDQHHILGAPLLSVELRFRTESLAISATMNPQRHG